MSTNSRGLKHGNFKSNWPTCLSPCGQSATQPKFAQFWGVRRSRAVLFVVSKRVGAIAGLLFLATAATARMRKVFDPKLLKWWLLKTRQIYVLFSVRKLQGNVSPLSVEPTTFRYSFRKNLYQNQMHAGRFSKEGCISKERHQMSSVFGWGMTLFLPQIITHLLDSLGEVRLTRGIGCDADMGNHDKSNT